jgi:hypothetical protein
MTTATGGMQFEQLPVGILVSFQDSAARGGGHSAALIRVAVHNKA